MIVNTSNVDSYKKKTLRIIKVNNGDIQKWILEWFPFTYAILNAIIRLVDNNSIFLKLCLLSLIIAGVLGTIHIVAKRYIGIMAYILFSLFSWILCLLFKEGGNYEFDKYIYSLMYMGMASILLEHRGNTLKYRILYFFVIFFVIYKILFQGASIRGFMLDGSTYNFIIVNDVNCFYLAL